MYARLLPAIALTLCSPLLALADEEDLFRQARQAVQDKDWKKAREAAAAYLKDHADAPGAGRVRLYLAVATFQEKDFPTAAAAAEDALKHNDPAPADRRQLLYWAGRARLEAGREKFRGAAQGQAKEPLRTARAHFLSLKKDFPDKDEAVEGRVHLAVALDLLDESAEAVAELRDWLAKNGKHASANDARYLLGRNLFRTKQDKESIKALGEYLTAAPKGPHAAQAYDLRARAQLRQKQYDAALRDLDKLLAIDPSRDHARLDKGLILLGQPGRLEEARAAFKALRDANNRKAAAEAAYQAGSAARKDAKVAREQYRLALELGLSPELEGECRYRLARIHYEEKHYPQCLDQCRHLVRPGAAGLDRALELLALCHEQEKGWRQALDTWERLARRNAAARPDALVRAGAAARHAKDDALARAHYEAARAAAPKSAAAARAELGLGHLYLDKKEVKEAEKAFRAARDLKKGREIDAAAGYWLGECLLRQHRFKAAAEQFEAVATSAEDLPEAPHAWLQAGTAHDSNGDRKKADRCYRMLLDNYPRHDLAAQAKRRLGE